MTTKEADGARASWLLFCGSLAIFLAVKLVWIWLPVAIMGLPRLGDDALVYLWWGENNFIGMNSQAVRDVLAIHRLDAYTTPELAFDRDRVTMRVAGAVPSPVLLLAGRLVDAGIDPKWLFAIQETLVLLVLAAGLAVFLARFAGRAAAGIALIILSVTFLPIQGLHYLVPGVLALAVGLFLFVLAASETPRPVIIFLLSLFALLTHQIGLIYVAAAVGANVLHSLLNRKLSRKNLFFVGAAVAAIAVAFLWSRWFGKIPESADGRGELSFANIFGNLFAFFAAWFRLPIILAIGVSGILLGLLRFRLLSPVVAIVAMLCGAIGASLFYDIPGYPGDVAIRLAVVLFALTCGGFGLAMLALSKRRFGFIIAATIVAVIAVNGGLQTYRGIFSNANERYALLDHRELAQSLSAFSPQNTILYGDADIALLGALIVGGDRFGALPFPMLRNNPQLGKILEARKPEILALIPPRELSGYSALNARSLQRRFYGYGFDVFSRIEIAFPGAQAGEVFLRLRATDIAAFSIAATGTGDAAACSNPKPVAFAAARGWYRIGAPGCTFTNLAIESADRNATLTGLAFAPPVEAQNWPWGRADTVLRAVSRRTTQTVSVDFSWEALLKQNDALPLNVYFRNPPVVISDRGGVIFAKIEVK